MTDDVLRGNLHLAVAPGCVGNGTLLDVVLAAFEVVVEDTTVVEDWPGRGPVHSTQYNEPDLRAEQSLTLGL
jgi:hypothetical protein